MSNLKTTNAPLRGSTCFFHHLFTPSPLSLCTPCVTFLFPHTIYPFFLKCSPCAYTSQKPLSPKKKLLSFSYKRHDNLTASEMAWGGAVLTPHIYNSELGRTPPQLSLLDSWRFLNVITFLSLVHGSFPQPLSVGKRTCISPRGILS